MPVIPVQMVEVGGLRATRVVLGQPDYRERPVTKKTKQTKITNKHFLNILLKAEKHHRT